MLEIFTISATIIIGAVGFLVIYPKVIALIDDVS